jgi:hypothetical protein
VRRLALDSEYRTYALDLTFDDPEAKRRPVIAIWADTEGAGRGVDIREVRLSIVPNPQPAATSSEPITRPAPAGEPHAEGAVQDASADQRE